MREKILAAAIAASVVFLLPGVTLAPEALAQAPSAPQAKTFPVQRFVARLPLASENAGPKKVVGPDGRESLGVVTTAPHVLAIDEKSGKILYAKGEKEAAPLASITKLMTAITLRGRGLDWERVVTIGKLSDGGGVAYFAPGDKVTVRNLWGAMLVGSSNTAVTALVGASGLSAEEFVREMNANAAGLGLAKARFVEPTGLDAGNVATPLEVATLARVALSDLEIARTVTQPTWKLAKAYGRAVTVPSTDKLLGTFLAKLPYRIIGGKTGFIDEGGYNVVVSVNKEQASRVTVVIMGASSSDLRFQEAKSVAYWAFANWRWPGSGLAAAVR